MDKIKTSEFTKLDDNTLQVVKQQPVPELITTTYSLDFLNQQLIDIQKQKDDFDALRDAELAEVQELIDQCNALGIKTKIDTEQITLSASDMIVSA